MRPWTTIGVAALLGIILGGAPLFSQMATGSLSPQGWLLFKDGRRLVDSRQRPVTLRNNPQARDVALAEVLAFVQSNQVNTLAYRTGQFACTEFAVALHDAAEAAGIRCALVGVRFQRGTGHALNAFRTTDKGLVYIDCTGSPRPSSDPDRYDTIGYLKIGQPYGRLPLELGAIEPARYERYTYIMGLWNWVALESQRLRNATLAGAEDETGLTPEELAARRAKLREQIRRLHPRYEMNPAPVKAIDLWW